MRYSGNFRRANTSGALLLAAVLVITGAARLAGQDFEKTFGLKNDETGRAIQETSDGGYIAAGYTQDPGTLETKAYVVRMDASGASLWERRFKTGGDLQTFGMDLKQLANGEHILVGTTSNSKPPCVGCAHIFAIRFTDNGNLVWYKTYGDMGTNQYATGVIETQTANPATGELVISGYDLDQTGEKRGVLMRLFSTGDIRWVQTYDTDPANINDNVLSSIDETQIGASPGDIVATGYVTSGADSNLWVLRVDGASGNIIAPPQSSASFSTFSGERGYSIRELRLGANPGDLVIAGEGDGRVGVTNTEILMLQTRPDPCDAAGQRADQYLGDNNIRQNYARCVREIGNPALGNVGDVIVTGASFSTAFGRSIDLFLQQFAEGTMVPVGPHHVYGGSAEDIGYGVGEISGIAGSPGFIVTGSTTSVPPTPAGYAKNLYVIRTNALMLSCTEHKVELSSEPANLTLKCLTTTLNAPQWIVLCGATGYAMDWGDFLCH